MTRNDSSIFRFAEFEVRESEFALVKAGEVLLVEPMAFRALVYLLRNPRKLITNQELAMAVWGNAAGADGHLTRSILLLRDLLGDDDNAPRFIAPVSTLGYCWVCPLEGDGAIETTPAALVQNPAKRGFLIWLIPSAAVLLLCLVATLWYRRPPPPPTPDSAPPLNSPAPRPTGDLKASASSVERGKPVILTWNVQNASSVEISGIGKVPASGSQPDYPSQSTVYRLFANGTALAFQQVDVRELPKANEPPVPQLSGELRVSANSVERGRPILLTWRVHNASSVEITGIGKVLRSGSQPDLPAASTVYRLIADGTVLASQQVLVREPAVAVIPQKSAPPLAPPPIQRQPLLPGQAALQNALEPYRSVFESATGKDCKSAFISPFGGKLKDFTPWCEVAKSFAANETSCTVGGTADAPTLSCQEDITMELKDWSPQRVLSAKIFRFKKGSDGIYQLMGW